MAWGSQALFSVAEVVRDTYAVVSLLREHRDQWKCSCGCYNLTRPYQDIRSWPPTKGCCFCGSARPA